MEIKAFHELKQIGKTPVMAKIGGFRPDPTAHSWPVISSSTLLKAGP
ncbi:hypothetical protein [Bacillus pumilus]|nr:hypothetical protein [Bacillus pumilus]